MNFTAQLPNGMTKAVWIASLKPGDTFCTLRPMKCSNCGENSLKHDKNAGFCPNMPFPTSKVMKWQPLPPKLKPQLLMNTNECQISSWKKYAICSGRGTKAICENCGGKAHKGNYLVELGMEAGKRSVKCGNYKIGEVKCSDYKPLSCELVSVMDEEEWKNTMSFAAEVWGHVEDAKTGERKRMKEEAKREGFETWAQLDKWITDYYGARPKMWRYEFRR